MKKENALNKLNEFIEEANSLLEDIPLQERKIEEWRDEVYKAITYIFPNSNSYKIAFIGAGRNPYLLDANTSNEQKNHILELSILDKKEVIIKIKKEIEDYWEEKKEKNNITGEKNSMNHIFISHISEEKELALVLKGWIEDTFIGTFDVFVSNDEDCITVGDKWLTQIKKAIDESKVLIAICSEASMPRPWINFEIGCAWAKDIPIMPICHTGITRSTLPAPISEFQGINIDNKESLEKLFKGIAKHLKVAKMPRISYQDMLDEINEALGKVVVKEIAKKEVVIKEENKKKDIHEIEEKILLTYSINQSESDAIYISETIKEKLIKTQFYIDSLVQNNYLYDSYFTNSDILYGIDHKGREYLVKNNLV